MKKSRTVTIPSPEATEFMRGEPLWTRQHERDLARLEQEVAKLRSARQQHARVFIDKLVDFVLDHSALDRVDASSVIETLAENADEVCKLLEPLRVVATVDELLAWKTSREYFELLSSSEQGIVRVFALLLADELGRDECEDLDNWVRQRVAH